MRLPTYEIERSLDPGQVLQLLNCKIVKSDEAQPNRLEMDRDCIDLHHKLRRGLHGDVKRSDTYRRPIGTYLWSASTYEVIGLTPDAAAIYYNDWLFRYFRQYQPIDRPGAATFFRPICAYIDHIEKKNKSVGHLGITDTDIMNCIGVADELQSEFLAKIKPNEEESDGTRKIYRLVKSSLHFSYTIQVKNHNAMIELAEALEAGKIVVEKQGWRVVRSGTRRVSSGSTPASHVTWCLRHQPLFMP